MADVTGWVITNAGPIVTMNPVFLVGWTSRAAVPTCGHAIVSATLDHALSRLLRIIVVVARRLACGTIAGWMVHEDRVRDDDLDVSAHATDLTDAHPPQARRAVHLVGATLPAAIAVSGVMLVVAAVGAAVPTAPDAPFSAGS